MKNLICLLVVLLAVILHLGKMLLIIIQNRKNLTLMVHREKKIVFLSLIQNRNFLKKFGRMFCRKLLKFIRSMRTPTLTSAKCRVLLGKLSTVIARLVRKVHKYLTTPARAIRVAML